MRWWLRAGVLGAATCVALAATRDEDVRIVLDSMGCMGCSGYVVTITGDGTVEYDGLRNVGTFGRRTRRIAPSEVDRLAQAFDDAGFFDLGDRYVDQSDGCDPLWMDQDNASLSVHRGGREKTVRYYSGCAGVPAVQALGRLTGLVRETADVAQWTEQSADDRAMLSAIEVATDDDCSGTACEALGEKLADHVLLLVDWYDGSRRRRLLLCRDGFLHGTDSGLAHVATGGIQLQLDPAHRDAIEKGLRRVRRDDDAFLDDAADAGWHGPYVPSVYGVERGRIRALGSGRADQVPRSARGLLRVLRAVMSDRLALDSAAIRLDVVPARGRLAPWRRATWPAEDVLPARDVGQRTLTASEWEALRSRLAPGDGPLHYDGAAFGRPGPVELVVLLDGATPRHLCVAGGN